MADAREPVEALSLEERDPDFFPLNDLPNDVLVSVFALAVAEDPTWVRHTFPLVCKAWNELYLTKDASPLHETLEVDFEKEVKRAKRERRRRAARPLTGAAAQQLAPYSPVVHASRVIAWAEGRAGSVRKLLFARSYEGALEDFSSEDLGKLVTVVGPSLTDILIPIHLGGLLLRPLWESLRDHVVPAGRLRGLVVKGIKSVVNESDVEPLGQLAGSLELLLLLSESSSADGGLPRFPESFSALTELRFLGLVGHQQITAIPAKISSLKKLEYLSFDDCDLSSLPKELGELSGLTSLNLESNRNLGNRAEAFPAELGKLKALRVLSLSNCGLRAVPAFVCELKSLENLYLNENDLSSLPKELGELSGLTRLEVSLNRNLGTTLPLSEAFPAELGKLKSLRVLSLSFCRLSAVPSFVAELRSLEHLGLSFCALRTVPAFVGGLESLESLGLFFDGDQQIDAPLDFLIEGFPRVRAFHLYKNLGWTGKSGAHLEAFEAKLRAKNPDARVSLSYFSWAS